VTRDPSGKSEDDMTRLTQSLQVSDLSQFARDLHRQLAAEPALPGHLALLNMLARAGGYRNYQHLRAQTAAGERIAAPAPPAADLARVETALRYFDAGGRMLSWPSKTNLQHLCLWGLWSRLPSGQAMTERQISAQLKEWHLFGDAAILRRTLVELGLVSRDAGVSVYLRQEITPPADARALIKALHQRVAA
jgi:hypothetical protein